MVHGGVHRGLAIRSSERDASGGPAAPAVPACYVGHTSLVAALRAKYGRGDGHSCEPYPQLITPIVTVFDGPPMRFVVVIQRLTA
jgi:hypothetical protein